MAFDFEAERDCRRRSVQYATTRHVAPEKSCAIAFLFPHALYFCVHGMLAHSLLISWLLRLCKPLLKRRRELLRYHRSQLAAGVVAWSGTHDVLVLSRKPGPSAWVGCARHSSSASRCCEERRATGQCRQESRRRQQLLKPNPRKRHRGKGWARVGRHD